MKIWFLSDTHTRHAGLRVPTADCVIHCGDEALQKSAELNEPEARDFFEWYSNLDIPVKVFTPGNHSAAVERGLVTPDQFPSVQFLVHEQCTVEGLTVFGSPYVPRYHDWSFMKKRTQLDQVWQTVPEGIDILITHGPPKGVLDLTQDAESRELVQVGCAALRRQVETRIRPRIHAFGHLHDERGVSNFGVFSRGSTQFINCSVVDRFCDLKNPGFLVEISSDRNEPPKITLA